MTADSPFPDLPPEIAKRVVAVRAASAETREEIGKESNGIQRVAAPARLDVDEISKAEHRVLVLICEGLSNEEAAERAFISHETVKTHVRRMLHRCRCRNRTQLAYRWARGELTVVLVSGATKIVIARKSDRA